MKIFLHIGNGKCGSSSLQHYFSYNHSRKGFKYGVLKKNGHISTGVSVEQEASRKPSNYAMSYSLPSMLDDEFLGQFRASLATLSTECEALLLSSEAFGSHFARFKQLDTILTQYEAEVIMIVRPPVQWLNSAWWQWLAWSNQKSSAAGIEQAVKKRNPAKTWLKRIEQFESLNSVRKVHVLSLNDTFLSDIKALIGKQYFSERTDNENKKHNAASSRELLSFLKTKRSLRPNYGYAKTEFILNKYLKQRTKSDWVLTEENVKVLMDKNKPYNVELAKRIANENILNNDAWWSADFYHDKCQKVERDYKLSYAMLENLLEEAYHIIIKLDDALRSQSKKLLVNGKQAKRAASFEHCEDNFLSADEITALVSSANKLAKIDADKAMNLLLIAQRSRPNGQGIHAKIEEVEKLQRAGFISKMARLMSTLPGLVKAGLK